MRRKSCNRSFRNTPKVFKKITKGSQKLDLTNAYDARHLRYSRGPGGEHIKISKGLIYLKNSKGRVKRTAFTTLANDLRANASLRRMLCWLTITALTGY